MPLRIAINGYGRIGRCFLRALHESPWRDRLAVVAINEPADAESMAYLTRFDSTHGRFPGTVSLDGECLRIDGQPIRLSHATTPEDTGWQDIDLLIEASGRYARRAELERFLAAGVPRLLLSQPGNDARDVDCTIVPGCNDAALTGHERLVSAASCTTNALVPVLQLLDTACGIEQAVATTLHSVMNDQPPIDGYHHADLRRTRSAMQSMVPVATGLARGVVRLLPQLAGRIVAKSIRVPVTNVSAIDLLVELRTPGCAESINGLLQEAANGALAGRLAVADEPHASIDFNHSPQSAIVDLGQTRVTGRLLNLLVWFDNEWGYANRMVELAAAWAGRLPSPGRGAQE